jgi:hypothetical protein
MGRPKKDWGSVKSDKRRKVAIGKKGVRVKEQIRMKAKKLILLGSLRENMGVVSTTCKRCGIHPDTFYDYMNNDPEFRAAVEAVDLTILDFGLSKLLSLINKGSEKSTIALVKMLAYRRGWITPQKIVGSIHTTNDIKEMTDEEINAELRSLGVDKKNT